MRTKMMNESSTDTSLIHRIATKRDKEAFEQLLNRYQRLLYSVALRFTKREHLAEDAVQRAMMNVWLTSGKFRETGNVRGWLVAIVSSESVKVLRKGRVRMGEVELESQDQIADSRGSQFEPEREEILGNLRTQFSRLSLPYRQVLTLYYCAELTQREIGDILKLPQRTVSDYLNKGLEALRSKLRQAGMAAGVSLLSAPLIRDALDIAGEMPSGLRHRILENVYSQPVLDASVVSSGMTRLGILGSVLFVFVVSGGLVAMMRNDPTGVGKAGIESTNVLKGSKEIVATKDPSEKGSDSDSNSDQEFFSQAWNFEVLPTNLENVFDREGWCNDEWCWSPKAKKTPGLLHTYDGRRSAALLPGTFFPQAFKIEAVGMLISTKDSSLSFFWSNNVGALDVFGVYIRKRKYKFSQLYHKETWYFINNYVMAFANKRPFIAFKYQSLPHARQVLMRGFNVYVDSIRISKVENPPMSPQALERFMLKNKLTWGTASPFTFSEKRGPVKEVDLKRFVLNAQKNNGR